MAKFIPGKQLSELFFKEVVQPMLKRDFPMLKYSAGLIGEGSDVLGFDTARSMDHDWGPRLLIFLSQKDINKKKKLVDHFARKLPYKFRGFSTHFGKPNVKGVKVLSETNKGLINHRIEIYTIKDYFESYLHCDVSKKLSSFDWLTLFEHRLKTTTQGKVFKDDLGLKKITQKLSYYPKDVWLFLLASQWQRISQEEHFMGRCAEVKDEVGSRILTARLVKDIMYICFLMERQYAPYIKWFGTAFKQLKCSKKVLPMLEKAIDAHSWKQRENYLTQAYEYIAKMHNKLKITKPLTTKVEHFHDRPFLVIHAGRFGEEIRKQIKDSKLRKITLYGSANQFIDSTDVLCDDMKSMRKLYK